MAKRAHRFLFVILAFAGSLTLVFILLALGTQSKGPLNNLLNIAGGLVSNMENKYILSQRSDSRKDKLSFLENCQHNPAALRNPKQFLLGVYDNQSEVSYNNIFLLEKSLNITFPLIHIYSAWGSKPEQEFPEKQVRAIINLGSIPVITWEPWLTDFDAEKFPRLREPALRDKGGMADIAAGKYDAYLTDWAIKAKSINHTMMLRFGHEMNDPYRYPWGPQNNLAKDYVAAWKHIRHVFQALGATNILWIWSPHPSYGWFDAFYPGDDEVDWVGVNILNYGTVAIWSKWWSFKEMFGAHYQELAKYKKPMMITEFGCLEVGGDRAMWFQEAFSKIPVDYPEVKSLMFFHYSADNTTTEQTVNWTILHDSKSMAVIKRNLQLWADSARVKR